MLTTRAQKHEVLVFLEPALKMPGLPSTNETTNTVYLTFVCIHGQPVTTTDIIFICGDEPLGS